jgi:FtsH-binding integral membrane protein
MKDKCCCCKQRERFAEKVYLFLGLGAAISLLFIIPIWIWATIFALWIIGNYPRITIVIIVIATISVISVMSCKISTLNDEAEQYNKQRERLEAAWPLEQGKK